VYECQVRVPLIVDRDQSPSVIDAARALQSIANGVGRHLSPEDEEELTIDRLIEKYISSEYRCLITSTPHANGGARVLRAHWTEIVNV
jgi:hypothetical protein